MDIMTGLSVDFLNSFRQIQRSLIILPFDDMQPELLTASLNKP
jgi:hypothetical protein